MLAIVDEMSVSTPWLISPMRASSVGQRATRVSPVEISAWRAATLVGLDDTLCSAPKNSLSAGVRPVSESASTLSTCEMKRL